MQYTVRPAGTRIASAEMPYMPACAPRKHLLLALSRRRAAEAAEKSIPSVNDSVPKRERPRCTALQSAGGGKQLLGAEK